MTSRPIPIQRPSPRGPSRSRGQAQSLPVAPASPHFGSVKAPPELVEAMPSLELPQSVTSVHSSRAHLVARSAPGGDLQLHSLRIKSKSFVKSATLQEESEVAGSLGQSLVSALSSLRVRNVILEAELDAEEDDDESYHSAVEAAIPKPAATQRHGSATGTDEEDFDEAEQQDDELQFELS